MQVSHFSQTRVTLGLKFNAKTQKPTLQLAKTILGNWESLEPFIREMQRWANRFYDEKYDVVYDSWDRIKQIPAHSSTIASYKPKTKAMLAMELADLLYCFFIFA